MENLIGSVPVDSSGKVDPEMSRRLREIEALPSDDKKAVKKLLDAFLLREKLQDLQAV